MRTRNEMCKDLYENLVDGQVLSYEHKFKISAALPGTLPDKYQTSKNGLTEAKIEVLDGRQPRWRSFIAKIRVEIMVYN